MARVLGRVQISHLHPPCEFCSPKFVNVGVKRCEQLSPLAFNSFNLVIKDVLRHMLEGFSRIHYNNNCHIHIDYVETLGYDYFGRTFQLSWSFPILF